MNSINNTRAKELKEALESVERALNSMGGEREKQAAVQDYFSRMHRTLQSQFVTTIIMPVLGKLDEMYTNEWTDLRNHAAAQMAHKMLEAIEETDRYLPLV